MLDLCTIVQLGSFPWSFKEEKENHGEENGKERGEYEFAEENQIRSLIFFRAKHHRNHLQFKITTCKVKTDKFSLVCYY